MTKKDQPRRSGAFWPLCWAIGLSLILHAAVVISVSGLSIIRDVHAPSAKLEWIDIDNDLGINATAAKNDEMAQQTPTSESLKDTQEGDQKKEEVEVEDKPKGPSPAEIKAKKIAMLTSEVQASSKSQASLTIFVNAKNVAKSPYALEAKRFLKVFYDYNTLLKGSSVNPIRDIDYLLIATPNPFRVTKTLLAIWLGVPESHVKNAISTRMAKVGKQIAWRRSGAKVPSPPFLSSDKRRLLLQNRFLLLGERKYISNISKLRKLEGQHHEIRDMKFGNKTWVNTVVDLDIFTKKFFSLGISVEAHQLKNMVRLPKGTVYPESISARVDVGNPVPVNATATFPTAKGATRFNTSLQRRLSKYSIVLYALGFGPLISKVKFKVSGKTLSMSASYTEAEAKKLLGLLSDVMPKVDVPESSTKTKPTPEPILVTPTPARGVPSRQNSKSPQKISPQVRPVSY